MDEEKMLYPLSVVLKEMTEVVGCFMNNSNRIQFELNLQELQNLNKFYLTGTF